MQRSKWVPVRCRRHGFVMLAVLVCLIVAGLALVTLAQRSMRLSALAIEKQRSLQHKWGVLSCQRTLLPRAAQHFKLLGEEAEQARKRSSGLVLPAPRSFAANFMLGGRRFELLLADENAKVNLNYSYHHLGRPGTERLVNRVLSGALHPPVRLYAHPPTKPVDVYETLMDDKVLPIVLGSWGQVFDLSRAVGPGAHRSLPNLTSRLTLWGRGELNVRRAVDATILDTCQLVVSEGPARQLQGECRDKDKQKQQVDRLVEQLNVDEDEQFLLQEMLTEHSSCFSLWTTVSSMYVESQQLAILQVDEEGVMRTMEFVY